MTPRSSSSSSTLHEEEEARYVKGATKSPTMFAVPNHSSGKLPKVGSPLLGAQSVRTNKKELTLAICAALFFLGAYQYHVYSRRSAPVWNTQVLTESNYTRVADNDAETFDHGVDVSGTEHGAGRRSYSRGWASVERLFIL